LIEEGKCGQGESWLYIIGVLQDWGGGGDRGEWGRLVRDETRISQKMFRTVTLWWKKRCTKLNEVRD